MRSFLREPLVHFLLIGAALFAVFEIFDDPAGPDSSRIVISASQIDFLEATFTRTWNRPPNEAELKNLVDNFVREEILYREALALGLDKNDQIVRRRLNQKMELMSSNLAQALPPSDDELRSYLADHPDRFRVPPRLSFIHIFLDPQKRGRALADDAASLLDTLSRTDESVNLLSVGDSLPLIPPRIKLMTVGEIGRLFGEEFGTAIMEIEPGAWAGPVRSGYGFHLVLITEKVAGRLPELPEIREQVAREWMAERKTKLNEEILGKLRDNYTVEIDWASTEGPGNDAEPAK